MKPLDRIPKKVALCGTQSTIFVSKITEDIYLIEFEKDQFKDWPVALGATGFTAEVDSTATIPEFRLHEPRIENPELNPSVMRDVWDQLIIPELGIKAPGKD